MGRVSLASNECERLKVGFHVRSRTDSITAASSETILRKGAYEEWLAYCIDGWSYSSTSTKGMIRNQGLIVETGQVIRDVFDAFQRFQNPWYLLNSFAVYFRHT